MPAGPDFRYTNFSGDRGCPHFTYTLFRVAGVLHFTYTHFSGGRGVAFYLHTLSGRFLNKIEKNDLKRQNFPRCARFFLSAGGLPFRGVPTAPGSFFQKKEKKSYGFLKE